MISRWVRLSSWNRHANFLLDLFQFGMDRLRAWRLYSLRWSSLRVASALLLQVLSLAVERAHAIDRLVDPVDQPLAFVVGEAELAHRLRDLDHCRALDDGGAGDDPWDASSARPRRIFLAAALLFCRALASSSIFPVNSFRRFCRMSSVISSSSNVTTSLIERTPFLRSSPKASSSWMTIGDRESAFSTRICPRSMRLAISTSPSRVSKGTVPISRKYMRTGSLVFSSAPGVRSSSTSSPASSAHRIFYRVRRKAVSGPPAHRYLAYR